MTNEDILFCDCNETDLIMLPHDDPNHEEGTSPAIDDGRPHLMQCRVCGCVQIVMAFKTNEPEPDTEEDVPF